MCRPHGVRQLEAIIGEGRQFGIKVLEDVIRGKALVGNVVNQG